MDINISIFVAFIAGILFTTLQGVFGSNHTVSWKICSNKNLYRVWGHGSNILVGDTLVFRTEDEKDDIARVLSKSEYEACRAEGSKALIYKGGEGIELNTSGGWYFMSRISDRCKSGEKVMIRVVAGSVVKHRSLRHGRGGGSGHGGGASGGNAGSGTPGGFTTPKGGNRARHTESNAAAAAQTRSFLIVLFALYSILFKIY